MSENINLTNTKDCDAYSLWKDVSLRKFLNYMNVSASNFLIGGCVYIQLVTQFHMFVLNRHISTQCVYYETCSCACSHTRRRVSAHFLTYEDMYFPHVQSNQSTISRLFNLRTRLTIQLLTYKDVSVCKLSHRRTCLRATFDIWRRVCVH